MLCLICGFNSSSWLKLHRIKVRRLSRTIFCGNILRLLFIYSTFRDQMNPFYYNKNIHMWPHGRLKFQREKWVYIFSSYERLEVLCSNTFAPGAFLSPPRILTLHFHNKQTRKGSETEHRRMQRSKRPVITIMVTIHPSLCSLALNALEVRGLIPWIICDHRRHIF